MSLQELMESLKAEYLTELPAKIAIIESHCNENSISHLREDFHKLKGTGKTYGIPELSLLAEVAEQMVLKKPELALKFKDHFIHMLKEIHNVRSQNREFLIDSDPRYIEIKKNEP